MGMAPDERVTNEIAREVCVREREKATISGSITGLDGSYTILLHAANCETGETLAREQVESKDKAEVLAALGDGCDRECVKSWVNHSARSSNSNAMLPRKSPRLLSRHSRRTRAGPINFAGACRCRPFPFFSARWSWIPNFAMAFQLLGNAYGMSVSDALSIEYSKKGVRTHRSRQRT